ncbi:MAG: hypothetical protein ACRDKB_07895 [Actinomycetota bacterium]
MFARVDRAIAALKDAVANLDPEVLEAQTSLRLVEKFAEAERLAAAGKALAAKRVAQSGAWKKSGARTPAHWMAHKTGTSVGQALGVLETAQRLPDLPKTDRAVRSGRLSEAQAREIASAAAASPSAEGELLEIAKKEGMATLKERCARVKAAAASDGSARYDRIHKRRRLRHWTDTDGAFRLDALLAPDSGAKVLAALEPFRERIFTDARKQGRKEPYEAYAADALVAMAEESRDGGAKGGRMNPKNMVHLFVDHAPSLLEDAPRLRARGPAWGAHVASAGRTGGRSRARSVTPARAALETRSVFRSGCPVDHLPVSDRLLKYHGCLFLDCELDARDVFGLGVVSLIEGDGHGLGGLLDVDVIEDVARLDARPVDESDLVAARLRSSPWDGARAGHARPRGDRFRFAGHRRPRGRARHNGLVWSGTPSRLARLPARGEEHQ